MARRSLTVGLTLALTLGLSVLLWAENAGGPPPGGPACQAGAAKPAGWMQGLTDEQRAQVVAKLQELKEAGKTPQEIHAAIAEMLKGWGIEPPAGRGPGAGHGEGKGQGPGWLAQLTPEQREQALAKVKELKEAGKTPQEIHAAIAEMLKGWGIEPPAGGGPGLGKGPGEGRGWLAQLTPEQREQVKAKLKELKEAGKTPQEIHAAIAEMLKGWGIEPPAPKRQPKPAVAEANV